MAIPQTLNFFFFILPQLLSSIYTKLGLHDAKTLGKLNCERFLDISIGVAMAIYQNKQELSYSIKYEIGTKLHCNATAFP